MKVNLKDHGGIDFTDEERANPNGYGKVRTAEEQNQHNQELKRALLHKAASEVSATTDDDRSFNADSAIIVEVAKKYSIKPKELARFYNSGNYGGFTMQDAEDAMGIPRGTMSFCMGGGD
jgi:hypothetical protein